MNFELNALLMLRISVIDVPNNEFLLDFTSNEKLKRLLREQPVIEVIVHFTPENVLNTDRYQQFMRTIDAKTHLIANDRNK